MKIYKLITVLLFTCLMPLFTSCEDSDDFSGTDNYITSFVIQKSGVGYAATITGNNINVAVPSNVDLSGATATCQTSEYATVSPNPSTVTDWSKDQELIVTSKNSSKRTYSYTMTRSDATEAGTVILRTQSDVKDFAAKNISALDGSLMIGENTATENNDSIKDLSALSSLKRVSGSFVVNNSFAGKSLAGLTNLTSVGNFFLGTTTAATAIPDSVDVSLPSLTSAGDFVVNNDKVKSVSLPALNNVYTMYLNGKSISGINVNALKTIYGDLSVVASGNKKLTAVDMNSVETVNGSLTISGWQSVKEINMEKLTTINGNMNISSMNELTKMNIGVQQIGGALNLSSLLTLTNPSLSKLKTVGSFTYKGDWGSRPAVSFDFPALETVKENLTIGYTSLKSLKFAALKSVGGQFNIDYNEYIESVSLPSLISCPDIQFGCLYKVESLDLSKITDLKSVGLVSPYIMKSLKLPKTLTNLVMNGGSKATVFPILEGLETVTGKFELSNYLNVPSITINGVKSIGTYNDNSNKESSLSLPDLKTVGTLYLILPKLTTLSAPKLTKVDSFDWEFFENEVSVDLSSLTTITGALTFSGASYEGEAYKCKLTNLHFFSTLKKIGSVTINWCGSLTDFSGLKNALPSLSASTWKVKGCKYNPTYQDMVDGKTAQ